MYKICLLFCLGATQDLTQSFSLAKLFLLPLQPPYEKNLQIPLEESKCHLNWSSLHGPFSAGSEHCS